ncbi:MAG: DUF368 domain-containing protein [Bacilli bacterium]|nr:DUF368 domain-containing protein [Bacilli bacterium]
MIAGLLIGIGAIMPGVSGGVIAVILGVYDKIIFSLNDFKKDKKKNFMFLFKISIGVLFGIIISSNILVYFFNKYFVEMSYLFIGLILGTIPMFINDYNKKCSNKFNYYLLVIVMLLSIFFSYYIKNNLVSTSNNILLLFISGFLFSVGKIIPGISSSVLLNLIGKYNMFLMVLSNPVEYIINNTFEFIIIFIGFIVGTIITFKLISYLLKKYYSNTYSVILGFVIGSLITLYPNTINFSAILIMLIGIVLSLGIPLIKR